MSAALDLNAQAPAWQNVHPVARVKEITPFLRAEAPKIEAGQRLTPAVLDALHARGLYRCLLPKEYGGDEVRPDEAVQFVEALAQADASTTWCVGQASICAMSIAYVKPHIAREIWGNDPRGVLAWGYSQGAVAKVVDGGYMVTGRWGYGSGGHHATWLGGHCQIEERDGSIRKGPDGTPIERTMLLRQDQVTWGDNWNVIGLKGTGSDPYWVKDLFVPEDYSVRRDVDEERVHPSLLYRFSTTNLYASCFAGVMMGIARRMLDDFKELANSKTPTATSKLMRDSQVTHLFVGQQEAKLRQARAWLLEVLRETWDEVQVTGQVSTDKKMMIRLASTSAIQRAREVAESCYLEAGTTAIFEENPFARPSRDMHAAGQQVQARTAHIEAVGAYMLGCDTNQRFI